MDLVTNRTLVNGMAARSESVLARSNEVFSTWKKYEYVASTILPYKPIDVWNYITLSELWHIWLGGVRKRLEPLPKDIRLGHAVKTVGDKSRISDADVGAHIIDGRNRSNLRIRVYDHAGNTLFYSIEISADGRFSTKIVLRSQYYHHSPEAGIIGKALSALFNSGRDEEPEGHKAEFESKIAQALKRFSGECYDLENYGASIALANENGGTKWWDEWLYEGGTLRINPDANNGRQIGPGTVFEEGEKIGYVFNPKLHASEEEAREKMYVHAFRKCVVRDVMKAHGDHVEKYDRLWLLEMVD